MKKQQLAAIYARISKEDTDRVNAVEHIRGHSESIQNQKLMLTEYAAASGFAIYKIYVDEDLSGFSDRPGFTQMIRDAAAGHFNIVLCKHQSRFTRDMELIERYIHGHFVDWGIRFISLTDNVDTAVRGNKKARQIYGLINEWYSEDLSENIRAVFRKKMEAGQFLGPFACYGYAKCKMDKHRLIADEASAKIVQEIFTLYLEGYGAARIAIELTRKNHPTPSGKNVAWSASTVRKILRNEAYIGTLIQGRERKVSYKSKKVVAVPKDEWVIVKNNHPPIIDEGMFYQVQNLIARKRRSFGDSSEKSKAHALAGKLICIDCGSTIERSGMSRDKSTYYLRCSLSAKTRKRDCAPHYIRQDRLEATVIKEIEMGGHGNFDILTHEVANNFIDTVFVGEKNTETGEVPVFINWLI